MNETRWDILAKIPEGQAADHVPEMMQNLLAERFKLAIHRENREQPVYALILGKGGLKIKEAAAESTAGAGGVLSINNDAKGVAISGAPRDRCAGGRVQTAGMQMQMAKITMAALADM